MKFRESSSQAWLAPAVVGVFLGFLTAHLFVIPRMSSRPTASPALSQRAQPTADSGTGRQEPDRPGPRHVTVQPPQSSDQVAAHPDAPSVMEILSQGAAIRTGSAGSVLPHSQAYSLAYPVGGARQDELNAYVERATTEFLPVQRPAPWGHDRFQIVGTVAAALRVVGRDFTIPASVDTSVEWYQSTRYRKKLSLTDQRLLRSALQSFEQSQRQLTHRIVSHAAAVTQSESVPEIPEIVAYGILGRELFLVRKGDLRALDSASEAFATIDEDIMNEARQVIE